MLMNSRELSCVSSGTQYKMSRIHQIHATVAASYGLLLCGLLFVWPSYTSSLYTDRNTTLLSAPMTQLDVSLIGSIPSLGAMLGTFFAGSIINNFGRHKGGLTLILPFLLSWIMVDLTRSSIVIMIARFIGGFASGAFLVYAPTFISEVAEESIRGFLASGPIIFYCLGILTSYLFGWFLTYRYIIWANMVLSCVGLIIIIMVTESPVWLMMQKREAKACSAMAHYRGASPDSKVVLEEISRLKAQVIPESELTSIPDGKSATEAEEEKFKVNEEIKDKKETVSTLKLIFTSPSTRRALVVTGLTISLQIMMGLGVVQVYAKDMFSNAVPSLSPHLCSVMLAATLLLGTLTSAVFSDRFGRRILLIVSALLVTLSLITMGLLLQTNILPSWVTALLILIYCFVFKLGAGNVPYILLAEVFIPEVHSTAAIILIEWVWLLSFIQLGIFPYIVRYWGIHGAFYFFSIFSTLDTLVAIFLLPETKGLTKEEIQKIFMGKQKTLVVKN